MKYKIPSVRVLHVKQMFARQHTGGIGPDATFTDTSCGWFIWLEGSYESLYVGEEKPELVVGDKVNITIEKVTS